MLYEGADDDAGQIARLIAREIESLWVFLEVNVVGPTNTNNRPDRASRLSVALAPKAI